MDTVIFTIPNVITIARLIAIPFIVWAMLNGAWTTAFVLFALAGASDGIDGFIARHWKQHSRLGSYLDPLADKALTIAVFSTFVAHGIMPFWLLALIVARDVAIVVGAGLMASFGDAAAIRPLMISKINTTVLILLAGWLLAAGAFGWTFPIIEGALIGLVVFLTAVSAAAYGRLVAGKIRRAMERKDGPK
ncbi:CDP-alcohol phosphatidyltransferase family protein [Oricola thermophila]|nr:CDP-alcohol phosphatidyltransferase family protein [Oricola thermophila]